MRIFRQSIPCPGICWGSVWAPWSPEALPEILECLIQKGLTVVPISELIYWENYTIDHTGRQFAMERTETA